MSDARCMCGRPIEEHVGQFGTQCPAGSSVPEAARAAARVSDEIFGVAVDDYNAAYEAAVEAGDRDAFDVAVHAALAAAVAEERATTGRRIEAVADEIEAAQQLADFDGVVKMRPAEIASRLRAALASPGEGE